MFKGVGKGAIALMLSGLICKFLGIFFRLPLTSILGIEGIGIFQMIMSLYSLALVFVTGGVTTALSQLISAARARGEERKIGDYFRLSSILTIVVALFIGVAFFFFALPISHVQGNDGGAFSYRLFVLLLPVGAAIGVLRGVIQGYENMTPTAISQILEQVFKVTLGLLFAYIFSKGGVASGVLGGFVGITLSEIIALVYLAIYALKIKIPSPIQKGNFPVLIGAILPLSLSSAVIPFAHAFDALVIISRLNKAGLSTEYATSLFGLETGVVGTILNIPLIVSLSLAMALLPKISFLKNMRDEEGQKKVVSLSFVAMWAIVLPLVLGIMALSQNIYLLLYPKTISSLLSQAVSLTFLGGIAIILTALMQFLQTLMSGQGQFVQSFLITLLGGIIKMLLVYFLAANGEVGIFALPISNIALAFVVCLIILLKLGHLIKISVFNLLIPLFSSIVMFYVVKMITFIPTANIFIILISAIVGGGIYILLSLPVLKEIFLQFFRKNE